MTKRPLIGITAGEIINVVETWAPMVYGQSHTYSDAVIHAGGTPFILPITDDEEALKDMYARCDGFLFAGGNDIEPERYGQKREPETVTTSKPRDDQEWNLMQWALQDDKPVLAICRGMQLMNVVCGGTLHQHIANTVPDAQGHTASKEFSNAVHIAHHIQIEPTSRLHNILHVDSIAANSQHHQAVHELGKGLRIAARAEDGVVEAIELADKSFAIGVQPHPEGLEASVEPGWRPLFRALVDTAVQRRGN